MKKHGRFFQFFVEIMVQKSEYDSAGTWGIIYVNKLILLSISQIVINAWFLILILKFEIQNVAT